MSPGADPAFQQAMDKLMLQVNEDNILAAHRVFRLHANQLRDYLRGLNTRATFGLCGDDPVSHEAIGLGSFGGKIRELIDVHWRNWEELDAVAAHLEEVARTYGHAEDEIAASLVSELPQ